MGIALLAVSIVFIIVGFIIGQKTVVHQEKLNNEEVLRQRALIETEIREKRKRAESIEADYAAKKKLISDAQESADKAYEERVKALDTKFQERNRALEQEFSKASEEFNRAHQEQVEILNQEAEVVRQELASLKATRDAAIEAARKEREVQEQPDKYSVPMTEDEVHDIEYLNNIMPKLKFPEVLGKCIWSVFFQKKMKAFLAGIFGAADVCGIYKVTDQVTGEAYIGQSVCVQKRMTEHLRAGVGATPASNANQLYAAMRRDGAWNFSFELLEECAPEELNDKERYFIDIYSSDVVGLNSKRGNQ